VDNVDVSKPKPSLAKKLEFKSKIDHYNVVDGGKISR
jgi:hypothetical protein